MSFEPFPKKPLAAAVQAVISDQTPDADALPVPAEGEPGHRRQRLHLWELAPKLHCPVIGTCLTPRELARVARRHNLALDARDPYELHG